MQRTGDVLDGVPIFIAVVEERSFTRAAKRLGISPSAVSQAVRSLEARLGTPLLMRSTRSLNLTPTGAAYFERAAPALAALADAAQTAMGNPVEPRGPLRLTMPQAAYDGIVAPALSTFCDTYPGVEVEVEIEGRLVDIAAQGFDAGLRYGDLVARDMAAVEVFPASRAVLAASPSYLGERPLPSVPAELEGHRTIVCRNRTTHLLSSWLLAANGVSCRIDPPAPMVAGDLATQIDLMVRGHGIACTPIQCIAPLLASGGLVPILPGWAMPLEPIYLYYRRRRVQSAALLAFIDHLLSTA